MKRQIIVLFGGRSDERHVSVASGQNVLRALPEATPWFWAPDGSLHQVRRDELLAHQNPFQSDFVPAESAGHSSLDDALDSVSGAPVFLLALHGGEGEDGTVQSMLERRGLPFTGSGSAASAIAFDKDRAKQQLTGRVRMAESKVASGASAIRGALDDLLSRHVKVVAKPLSAGSSRGLFFVDRAADLDATVEEIAKLDLPYILEQFVGGRELTVGVLDDGTGARALPVIEIEVDPNRAFDYEGKYLGSGTREICPANIPDALAEEAQACALAAHVGLGCEGYSRSDMIASQDGVYFLELNTLPGLTTSSLVPQELREIGVSFTAFLEQQIELACTRAASAAA